MKKLIALLIILLLAPVILGMLFERVPPAKIGVKQTMWGGEGIVKNDFQAGFHLGITGYHKWYLLPERTHFAHFTESDSVGGDSEIDARNPPLNIRTLDANEVLVDVSVAYRILPGRAHELVQAGAQASYPVDINETIRGVLRTEIAKLSSEDLQSTETRLKVIEETLPLLNEQMETFYCEAEAVLIRRFEFEPEYEARLQEKQFLRQRANLDEAQTMEAEEQKRVNLIDKQILAAEMALTQDWEKRIQEKRSEYEVLIAQIDADARIYEQRTVAEGDAGRVIAEANGQLAIEKAEALRKELRTEALNSEGGSILLALEAAGNLNMPSVTLNSSDPAVPMILDLQQLTDLLVGMVQGAGAESE